MLLELPIAYINGRRADAISPYDRGFSYGDGLFETCRVSYGSAPLMSLHLARLSRSCAVLSLPLNELQLTSYLNTALNAVRDEPDITLKIIITRGPGGRGYRPPENPSLTYCLLLFPAQPLIDKRFTKGITTRVCDRRLVANPALAGLKHLNRLEQVLARSEWGDEFDEGILLGADDTVIEGTATNLFLVRSSRLITPTLHAAGVDGVLRQYLLDASGPLKLDMAVQEVSIDELVNADELFLCNSICGIWPIRSLVHQSRMYSYQIGTVTRRLQASVAKLFDTHVDGGPA